MFPSPNSTPGEFPTYTLNHEAPIGQLSAEKNDINEEPDTKRIRLSTPGLPHLLQEPMTTVFGGPVATPLSTASQKQLERMEKQKQRELERLEREIRKEQERQAKREERERKELEKKLRREQIEKEKEQKREEERLRREEKRKKVEEERKRKDEERRKKELERKAKEEERKRKEEQKERSQMKISSFFSIKQQVPTKPKTEHQNAETSKQDIPCQVTSQYEKDFLPFFIKKNVVMAPSPQLLQDELLRSILEFDKGLSMEIKMDLSLISLLKKATEFTYTNSEQLVQALNSPLATEKDIQELVSHLPPIKYLQFYENSKPPYIGTWCSVKHLKTIIEPTDVLDTTKTGFDYDYDSDLDWDGDDEDGEDIDELEDGEDDDDEINEEDDMDDFVEENGDTSKKRIPVNTVQSTTYWNDGSSTTFAFFDALKYERLDANIPFPINPFKDYWGSNKSILAPPKQNSLPLTLKQLGTPQKTDTTSSTTPNILTPQKPTIKEPEIIKKLVAFIKENNDFSIGTLSELAKKEFKTYTKSILKHTIQEVAVYNKKKGLWEIKEEQKLD